MFHCEPIEKIAEEFIEQYNIQQGMFDNEDSCQYEIPDYWTMGEVYERLIEVYCSWMDDFLSDYNIAVYYQSREYIAVCYREGRIL